MADFNALQAIINAYIKRNGVQAITGQILNGVLTGMVNALGKGYTVAGAASPTTDPGTMTGPLAYIAYTAGTYTHFDNIVVEQGEVSMLIYNEAEWHKEVLFSLAAQATVDDNIGVPSVGVSFVDGILTFNFRNMKGEPGENGQDGDPAGFGTISASISGGVGTPGVSVQSSGPDTAKNIAFQFTNLKGETGVTSCVVTVDNTTGTPSCAVSLVGQELHLDFSGLKGAQGNTGSSVNYPFEIVNNLTTPIATKALSAAMGVQLESEVSQLEAKVTNLKGKFYGFYPTAEDLPEGNEDGFAYVGDDSPYAVYNFQNEEWTDSGSVVTISGTSFTPDDEDLSIDNSVLKFADRPYNSQTPDGLGYKILRKDATFASQVTATNTIYEIRYDFTLSANVSIPANCELRFNGGKIIGGGNTITLNKTLISGNGKFDGCEFAGTLINGEVLLSWFTDGMSANNDYSVDHTTALISAMKLTARKDNGWLNLERIPICIKQTIVITNAFGNIGMKGGNIFFLSTADRQALFDYQQASVYSGAYSHIVDFWAKYVGSVSAPSTKHENVCFIKKTNWSDTAFTYWRDIFIYDFTGYFMVNQTYLQEVTFQNISCYGVGGFFSNNSDQLFGETKGSGNIMHFLNCNLNGGISTGNKTNIHYLWDLHNVIEADLVNIVNQGRVPGSNIYPLRISCGSSIINSNITLDGFWVEYVDGHVNKKILIEDATVVLTLKKHSPNVLEILGNYVTVKFENAGGDYIYNVVQNSTVAATANVDWQFDSALLAQFNGGEKFNKFRELADRGIIADFRNGISNYPAASVPINIRTKTEMDYIANYASVIDKSQVSSNSIRRYFTNENGVDILCFEDIIEGTTNHGSNVFANLKDFLPFDTATTLQEKAIMKECIYRATILVDVTEENVADVKCTMGQFVDWPSTALITPKVGDLAGTTTGWLRGGWTYSAPAITGQSYLTLRYCKLEIASFKAYWRNGVLDNELLLKNGVLSTANKKRKIYDMSSIPANKDNVTDMSEIIRGAKGVFVTPKNAYMYVNGAVRAIYDYNAKGGTTVQRPTLASGDVGFTYYDSNLGKTIVWDGSAWVNLDGTALS